MPSVNLRSNSIILVVGEKRGMFPHYLRDSGNIEWWDQSKAERASELPANTAIVIVAHRAAKIKALMDNIKTVATGVPIHYSKNVTESVRVVSGYISKIPGGENEVPVAQPPRQKEGLEALMAIANRQHSEAGAGQPARHGSVKTFVQNHLAEVEQMTPAEAARMLMKLAQETGLSTTEGSLTQCLYQLRREGKGAGAPSGNQPSPNRPDAPPPAPAQDAAAPPASAAAPSISASEAAPPDASPEGPPTSAPASQTKGSIKDFVIRHLPEVEGLTARAGAQKLFPIAEQEGLQTTEGYLTTLISQVRRERRSAGAPSRNQLSAVPRRTHVAPQLREETRRFMGFLERLLEQTQELEETIGTLKQQNSQLAEENERLQGRLAAIAAQAQGLDGLSVARKKQTA